MITARNFFQRLTTRCCGSTRGRHPDDDVFGNGYQRLRINQLSLPSKAVKKGELLPANISIQVSYNLPQGLHYVSDNCLPGKRSPISPFFGIAKSKRPLRDSVSRSSVRPIDKPPRRLPTHPLVCSWGGRRVGILLDRGWIESPLAISNLAKNFFHCFPQLIRSFITFIS